VAYLDGAWAWVWSSGQWRGAPGLISKARCGDGIRLTREQAEVEFPEADFPSLDAKVAARLRAIGVLKALFSVQHRFF
jgi:hypothetical protein